MSRRLLLALSTAAVLVLPGSAQGQARARASAPDCPQGSVECQVFEEAFEYILRMHLSAYSDSTLAIDTTLVSAVASFISGRPD